MLVLVHGVESSVDVQLPKRTDVTGYTLLWDSSHAAAPEAKRYGPGQTIAVGPTSLLVFAVD